MAKIKEIPRPALLTLTLISCLAVSGFIEFSRYSFHDLLSEKLERHNQDYYTEKAYLVTDRFVYRPGEDVWFQGYISSPVGKLGDSPSEDMYVKLLNSKGEEIIFRRYPVSHNQITGRFLIPRTSIPGKYYLVAYTGWMKNQSSREAFKKEILISRYYDKRFQVEVMYDRISYFQGDTLHANLRFTDPAGEPLEETEFTFEVGTLSKTLFRGSGSTDHVGSSRVECIIPASDDILLMQLEIRKRVNMGDFTLILPVTVSAAVRFFPEGGRLVSGIENTVAFHSTGPYGLPAAIEGEIVDRDQKLVIPVSTNMAGKGRFRFVPSEDTFYLRIIKPRGISRLHPLPLATKEGIVLHFAKADPESVVFDIKSLQMTGYEKIYCVAVMNRKIVWKDSLGFEGSAEIKIPVAELQEGFMQVSCFNNSGEILADRLLFIPGKGQGLVAKTDRPTYHPRQRVMLMIESTAKSSRIDLALSVALRQLALHPPMDDFSRVITAYPMDTVTRAGWHPVHPTDLDLLTSGYKPVDWNEVMTSSGKATPYGPKNGLSGKVVDKKENLSQHAKVRVTHIPSYRFYETQTNENGYFHIPFGSDIVDFNFLNIDAWDAPGKMNLTAIIDQEYSVSLRNHLLEEEENSYQQKIRDVISYGDPDLIYSLRYGPRKFSRADKESGKKYNPNSYSHYASVLEIIHEMKPYVIKNGTIVFVSPEQQQPLQGDTREGVIIVINGALKGNRVEILNNLMPSDITNINISTSLLDVHRYTPINFQGVIELTTIQGMFRYRQPAIKMGTDILKTTREFYSPDYSIESPTSADNRKTLCWIPQITLGIGKPALISFYTSDVKGIYHGVVEGMDEYGRPVRTDFSFTVE